MCNVLHKNLKEKTMFDFEKQYKNYEQVIDRIKEANEFWFNAVLSTAKDFLKVVKTK